MATNATTPMIAPQPTAEKTLTLSNWRETVSAIQAHPCHPEGFFTLATLAAAAGDYRLARKLCHHALTLAPKLTPATELAKKLPADNPPTTIIWPDLEILTALMIRVPRLSVCLIAKNEEQFIGQCLDSVKGLADQVVLTDTGSTDRTVEIAQAKGAEIFHFSWNNSFSDARNVSLKHASGDWILLLDADETLSAEEHDKIRKQMADPRMIGFRLPLISTNTGEKGRSFLPRLFRNAAGLCFTGRIHEQIFPSAITLGRQWGLEIGLGHGTIVHYGYDPAVKTLKKKAERNLALLKQAVLEEPNNPNIQMNLGLELFQAGEIPTGLNAYHRAFELMSALPSAELEELREVLLTQYASRLFSQGHHEEVVKILTSPLAAVSGLTASMHYILGGSLVRLNKISEAASEFERCLAKRNTPVLTPVVHETLGSAPRHWLAKCLEQTDKKLAAEVTFKEAIKEDSENLDLLTDYARFLATQARPVEALELLHKIVNRQADHTPAWQLGGQIGLSQPEFREFVLDWTGEAIKYLPQNEIMVKQRASAFLINDQPAAAIPFWQQTDLSQPKNLAALIICQTAQKLPAQLPSTVDQQQLSQHVLTWFKSLIQMGAANTVNHLVSNIVLLEKDLPQVAQIVKQVTRDI